MVSAFKKAVGFLVLFHSFTFVFSQPSTQKPVGFGVSETNERIIEEQLVNKFYEYNGHHLFWFASGEQSYALRRAIKTSLDSSVYIGLCRTDYHYQGIAQSTNNVFQPADSLKAMIADRIFTDAAIKYCKDIYQGRNISSWVSTDELSAKYAERDNDHVVKGLIASGSGEELIIFLKSLEPFEKEYSCLKSALAYQLQKRDSQVINQLNLALNLFRWIYHFELNRFIVVNIPSATLRYYESDSIKLRMKVVVGKPSTRTPRFSAYCNQIILYPYWNVPRRIATHEYLPLFKHYPNLVDSMNMQIIDGHGNIIDPDTVKWSLYNKNNFPYQIRQSTGCDNALGVVKFNLTDPYDVYMHDTNFKSAFLSDHRYYSHGCIRLEKPIELAGYLLDKGLDNKFLESCLKNQSPVPLQLISPIPVFVVYIPVEAITQDNLSYYNDIYGLLR